MTSYTRADNSSPCMTCRGTGVIRGAQIAYGPVYEAPLTCWMCGGSGVKSIAIMEKSND